MRKPTIVIISIALIIGAVGINRVLVMTAPKASKNKPPRMATLVETRALKNSNETVVLELTGTVVPAEAVILSARVGGEIVSMSADFIDGGLLEKGAAILKIDPVDYRLARAETKSKLETARSAYKMELGRQDVAQREWELLKTNDATEQEKELALRIPQLGASKAALEAAEATFKKANLNLSRTQVSAPFNAIVLSRDVNIGSQATASSGRLASLAGTDAYWIKVSIAVDRLSWLDIPGSEVKVLSSSGAVREGRVIKLLGNLEEKGRMARLLVEVKDPLCLLPENSDKKPLLIGEFIRAKVSGRVLENVYSIPRNALHDDRFIWIAQNDKLDIREIEVLWRDAQQVLVRDGLADGDQLIVSDMTTPIQGVDINTGKKDRKPRNTPNTRKPEIKPTPPEQD